VHKRIRRRARRCSVSSTSTRFEGGFSQAYDAGTTSERPLGDAPLLLARIQTGHGPQRQPIVALHPAEARASRLSCRLGAAALGLPLAAIGGEEERLGHGLKLPGTEPQEIAERGGRAHSQLSSSLCAQLG